VKRSSLFDYSRGLEWDPDLQTGFISARPLFQYIVAADIDLYSAALPSARRSLLDAGLSRELGTETLSNSHKDTEGARGLLLLKHLIEAPRHTPGVHSLQFDVGWSRERSVCVTVTMLRDCHDHALAKPSPTASPEQGQCQRGIQIEAYRAPLFVAALESCWVHAVSHPRDTLALSKGFFSIRGKQRQDQGKNSDRMLEEPVSTLE
jgi:hypothetical protein